MANSAFNHSPSIVVPGSSTNTALVRWSGTGADTFTDSTIIVGATTMGLAADTDLLTFGNGTLAITGAVTGVTTITATTFSGALSGNATSATSAVTLTSARNIGGVSFNGSAAIVPTTIAVTDTTDASTFVGLWTDATGDLLPKTDAALTYNASNGALTAVTFHGSGANLTNLPGGGPSQATQAAVKAETNEDTYIPPDLLLHNPYVAKHWGEFEMVGTHSITHSLNWTSVSDGGEAGNSDLLYATDFSEDDQILIGSADSNQVIGFNVPVAGGCFANGSGSDSSQCYVVGWGDRA